LGTVFIIKNARYIDDVMLLFHRGTLANPVVSHNRTSY
jgi:hypothetical protein